MATCATGRGPARARTRADRASDRGGRRLAARARDRRAGSRSRPGTPTMRWRRPSAALVEATASGDVEARCAALDVQARALDYVGRRDEAASSFGSGKPRRPRRPGSPKRAAASGRTARQARGVQRLAARPAVRGGRAGARGGALVEQAWAEENLAIALAMQGDPDAGLKVLDDAMPRCRELRLDQLPYLLAARRRRVPCAIPRPGRASSTRPSGSRRRPISRSTPTASAPTSRCAPVATPKALEWCERCVELVRALPGGMPSDAPCWLVWARAAVGVADDAARGAARGATLPDDLARWHGRPVLLAARRSDARR